MTRYVWTGTDWTPKTAEVKAAANTPLKADEVWRTIRGARVRIGGDGKPTDPAWRARLAVSQDKMAPASGDTLHYAAEGRAGLRADDGYAADDRVLTAAYEENAALLGYLVNDDPATGQRLRDAHLEGGFGWEAVLRPFDATSPVDPEGYRRVPDRLARETGLDREETLKSVLDWGSSATNGKRGAALTEAARSELGAATSPYFEARRVRRAQADPDLTATYRPLVRQMYADTQEDLKRLPGDSLTLYRGVTVSGDAQGRPASRGYRPGDTVNLDSLTSPLSSWSADPNTARTFGNVVIKAQVPKARILSTWRTGLGEGGQYEVVVIGAKGDRGQVWHNLNYTPDRKATLPVAEVKSVAGSYWVTINGRHVLIGEDGKPTDPGMRARLAVSQDKMAAPTGPVPNAEPYGSQAADHTDIDYHAGDAWRADEEVLTRAYIDNAYPLAYVLTGHPERGEALRNWPATRPYGWQNTIYTDQDELGTLLPKQRGADRIALETGEAVHAVRKMVYDWNTGGLDSDGGMLLSMAARDELGAAASRYFTSIAKDYHVQPGPTQKRVALQMYADTQAELAKVPGDTVTLYRGIKVGRGLQKYEPGKPVKLDALTAPLQSWSADPDQARRFGNLVIKATVPKSRIFSTHLTGAGSWAEAEFVVLGAKGDQAQVWANDKYQYFPQSKGETKARAKAKSKGDKTPPGTHWVTMNGAHVLMDDALGEPVRVYWRERVGKGEPGNEATDAGPIGAPKVKGLSQAKSLSEAVTLLAEADLDASYASYRLAARPDAALTQGQFGHAPFDAIHNTTRLAPEVDGAQLAERAGVPLAGTSEAIDAWNLGELDGPTLGVSALQRAAAQEFGGSVELYTSDRYTQTLVNRKAAIVGAQGTIYTAGNDRPGILAPFEDPLRYLAETPAEPDLTNERKLLRQMYADTQKDLASTPGDTVTLYRALRHTVPSFRNGGKSRIRALSQPLQSWTLDPRLAEVIGDWVLVAKVPKTRILSTWRTGLGTQGEAEVVVLGGNDDDVALTIGGFPKWGNKAAPLTGGRWVTLRNGQHVYLRPKAGREAITAGPMQAVRPAYADSPDVLADSGSDWTVYRHTVEEIWQRDAAQSEAVYRFIAGQDRGENVGIRSWQEAAQHDGEDALMTTARVHTSRSVDADALAEAAGVGKAETGRLVDAWNVGLDTNRNEAAWLAVQKAAVDEFGGVMHPRVTERWDVMVKGRREAIAEERRIVAAIKKEGGWVPSMREQTTWDKAMPAQYRTAFEEFSQRNVLDAKSKDAEPDVSQERKLLRQMYADTQRDLASIPGDTVTVYRGIRADALGVTLDSQRARQGKTARVHRLDAPLTSWSLDPATARSFSTAMLVAKVPKSRIVSTWRTGLGVATEAEVLVLGGNPADQALVLL